MNGYKMANQEAEFNYDYGVRTGWPEVPPHFHNCYELLFYQQGNAQYLVEGNLYALTEGDLLITNPREMHCPVFRSEQEYRRSIIFLKPSYLSAFITGGYDPFTALNNRKIGTQNKIDTELVRQYGIDKLFEGVGKAWEKKGPEEELLIKSYLIQLLVQLNRIVTAQTAPAQGSTIDALTQYINENLTEDISLGLLGERFHLSKYHIAHLFKEKTGFGVIEYITHKRVTLAKELILHGMPLAQVSETVGFHEYSCFYRAFSRIIGVSPSRFH